MSVVFHAILGNRLHPEYGVATVPFPIPAEEYDHVVEMMEALEIGSPTSADCQVYEINDNFPVLKRMENLSVNLDELDYLAKRLDSFCDTEAAQFQAMAHKLETFTAKDFINLTFCCQNATVITDFSDLESVGKDHYLALHGGMAPTDELDQVDGVETALLLIESGSGVVTPYGVVYDNGTKLEEVYDGRIFPNYESGDAILTLTMSDQTDTMKEIYLYLPMPESKVERVLYRAGIQTYKDIHLDFAYSALPKAFETALNVESEDLLSLNDMARAVMRLDQADRSKLGAVVEWLKPESADEITNLAGQLELFDFVPAVSNAKEYGRYMIIDSGHFEYDENLDEFYDFEGYGLRRMDNEQGEFTSEGYVSYQGDMSLDEVLAGNAEEVDFQMGGIR